MSIITMASSKGGAGKTTSAIILATTLSRHQKVVLIDADPAQRLVSWAGKKELPQSLKIHRSKGEQYIHDEIDRAKEWADHIVIDLEGAATRLNAFAMSESDLVVIPMGDEQQDAEGAIETLSQLQLEASNTRREIPVRILFCRTQAAVKSRLAKSLNGQVRDKIGSFETELHTRTAYSALHNYGGTLYTLDPEEVSGVNKAIANAELFMEELLQVLDWIEDIRAQGQANQVNNIKAKDFTNAS